MEILIILNILVYYRRRKLIEFVNLRKTTFVNSTHNLAHINLYTCKIYVYNNLILYCLR